MNMYQHLTRVIVSMAICVSFDILIYSTASVVHRTRQNMGQAPNAANAVQDNRLSPWELVKTIFVRSCLVLIISIILVLFIELVTYLRTPEHVPTFET